MRLDESVDAVEIVDARRIFDVGRIRVLVAFAEAHQRFMRPRIIVIDRYLDDARLDDGLGLGRRLLDRLQLLQHVGGLDHVGIELHLHRGIGGADLGDTLDLRLLQRRRHRQ